MAESKFEKDLEKLEQVVEALETGGLSLDDLFRSVHLSKTDKPCLRGVHEDLLFSLAESSVSPGN